MTQKQPQFIVLATHRAEFGERTVPVLLTEDIAKAYEAVIECTDGSKYGYEFSRPGNGVAIYHLLAGTEYGKAAYDNRRPAVADGRLTPISQTSVYFRIWHGPDDGWRDQWFDETLKNRARHPERQQ